MGYELSIDFFGICAFVHGEDWKRIDVILPATHKPKLRCGHEVPPHEARLLVSAENLKLPISDEFFDRQVSLPDGHWFSGPLDGYTMSVADAKKDSLVVRNGLRPPGGGPCPKYDSEDISWLAEMELACGDGKINPAVIEKNHRVLARVTLTDGSLQCARLAQAGDGAIRFSFDEKCGSKSKTNTKYVQALAESLRYTRAAATIPTLKLTRHNKPKNQPIEIKFQAPLGTIRTAVSHLPETFSDEPYSHFHSFYDLAASGVPHNVPVDGGTACKTAPQLADTRNWPRICPGTMFYTDKF